MDWKYKHFAQEAIFEADREKVDKAVRAFADSWLAKWEVSETGDGLEARGRSGGHKVTANLRIEAIPGGGNKLAVSYQVSRAGYFGFVLGDFGGYYNSEIYKWLRAIGWRIQETLTPVSQWDGKPGEEVSAGPPIVEPPHGVSVTQGCITAVVLIPFCIYAAQALVGLLTGNLFIPGRRGFGISFHGLFGRILSAIILWLFCWMVLRILKPKKRTRGPGWRPPLQGRFDKPRRWRV